MSPDRIRIDRVSPEGAAERWKDEAMPWGLVWYEVLHDDGPPSFMTQRFSRSGEGRTRGGELIWAAMGDDDSLTLTPSFMCRFPYGPGEIQREVVVHLFLRGGKIELCGDSTVVLA